MASTWPPPKSHSRRVGSPVIELVVMTVASTGTFWKTLWLADVPKIGSGTPAMIGWSGSWTSLNSS